MPAAAQQQRQANGGRQPTPGQRRGPVAAAEPEVRLQVPSGYRSVAVALDFSGGEERMLNEALRLAQGAGETRITLLHVVESPAARIMGDHTADLETEADRHRLEVLVGALEASGYTAQWRLGLGHPVKELARLVAEVEADVVVLGAHGHRGVADLIHGTTADALRHRVDATVVIVPLEG